MMETWEQQRTTERVKFEDRLASLRRSPETIPDHRTGRNIQYDLVLVTTD